MSISIRGTSQHQGQRRVHAIAVANNGYAEGFAKVFTRETLDRGILTVYLLKRLTPFTALRMTAEIMFGLWRRDAALTFEETTAVTIDARPSSVEVMIDGEVETMSMPLDFRIKSRALNVLAPAPDKAKGA
jgi:diacylglycerol kinase family enzyme